ncbi:hypothetical protein LCGC14_2119540 [marine sediment metagenome]|uniref:Uncharacterized protein n=1 Tax=marine sediment metagenome TaxID=412755 RepID=A0A0F9GHT0_9ZZZZ
MIKLAFLPLSAKASPFTINDTAVDLGALDTASVSTDTTNFDVTTNASSGYTVTITEDGNLRDGGNDVNDVGDGTVTAASEEYGVSTDETDSVDIALTSGNNATAIDATNKSAATQSGPISSDNTVLTFHASISLTTNPGNYAHTTTMIATGNF